ncbi:MAG: MFS transporter [Crocinitomicaceae bacterium]|nr:MFS transporter [Crocinitomicaceae bacterium]
MEKGDKKIIRGWVFYDWANSVYNLVISSAIFPIFYNSVTTKRHLEEYNVANNVNLTELPEGVNVMVNFFGMEMSSSVLMSFVLSASFLVVSFLSPMLSGVADFSGSKKKFMQFFCYLGAISCISLYWFEDVPIEVGMISIFLASIGFWNSLVFYNAYLPEIAEKKDHDRISARGFSMGYFGSMILLVICLAIVMLIDPAYTSWSFILVGLWWIGFSQITYRVLPNNVYGKKKEKGVVWKGFKELKKVFNEFKKIKRLKRYLSAFFFFNTGVQTVMLMAVLYASREIFVGEYEAAGQVGLIVAILLIQILGAVGAFLLSRLSGIIGNLKSLIIVVTFWVPLCIVAYFITTPVGFYFLASGVGLVMGGVQALSRSTYSKFLPETEDHASYFSFYDVTEKIGIVFGTFFFGFMEYITGDIRSSILSVVFFFTVGLLMLLRVPKEEKILAVK